MKDIKRHKVFISYYHEDDQDYKDYLLNLNDTYNIFDDYSVHEDEIDDTGMTDEQVRREIRDNYIAGASVLILLCGENTKKRKHIDWEIHAAMYDSEQNPKMGILVINLPSITSKSKMLAHGVDEQNAMGPNVDWVPASREWRDIQKSYPYLPKRIATNLTRDDVQISIANWENIYNDVNAIMLLIDSAFNRRKSNKYDHSTKLQGRNS